MPKVLVLGNSHCQALKPHVAKADDIEVHWVRSNKPGAPGDISAEQGFAAAAALGPEDSLVLMRLGTMHNVIGLLNADPPFALHDEGAGTGAQIIPRASLATMIRAALERDRALPRYLRECRAKLFHIMPPRPKEDLSAVRLPPQAYRGRAVAEFGFAPGAHRLALWQLEERILTDYLTELGIIPLSDPPRARTAAGFLHPDYWGDDATHANPAYGALMLALIGHQTAPAAQSQAS